MPKEARTLTKRLSRCAQAQCRGRNPRPLEAYIADASQPGLYARARRGRVEFVFIYRPPAGGARRRLHIDWYGAITLEQAREIALRHRAMVAETRDPQEERRRETREGKTVAQAIGVYLADLKRRAEGPSKRGKRSGYEEARRRLERNVLPRLGARQIRSVGVPDVRARTPGARSYAGRSEPDHSGVRRGVRVRRARGHGPDRPQPMSQRRGVRRDGRAAGAIW